MIGEEEYFRLIEEHFLQKRGNPVLLSPKEWVLIHEWYDAAIPEEVVLRAINRAFEKKDEDKKPLSLRYCGRLIKSEHKKYLKSLEGKTRAESADVRLEAKNVQQFLDHLQAALEASSRNAADSGNSLLADFLLEKRQQLSTNIVQPYLLNQSNDLQRVERGLTELEKEIEGILLSMIAEEQMALFKEEAMRDLKMFEGKVELSVYQEMIRRSLIKAVRNVYQLPRLSLFYM